MNKMIQLALFITMLAGSSITLAADCVPTKTPQQAAVILSQGQAAIQMELQKQDQLALDEYNRTIQQQLAAHDARMTEAHKIYVKEASRVSETTNPGWREELDAVTTRYNQTVEASRVAYLQVVEVALNHYNRHTEAARNQYSQRAQALAAEYNRSVCAVTGRR